MHITLVITSNIFHNAKYRYSFLKLFYQIMELNMKWSSKIHLQPKKCTISSSWEKPKTMFSNNLDFQKLTIWMSFGLLPLTTNSSNLLSISLRTSVITKRMVVVAKWLDMWHEKLRMASFNRKSNFRWGSYVGIVITFVVVESSIV